MGSLFSTLNIARSGLAAAQTQLDVTGHNIANVNKTGFSRQRAELVTRVPITRPWGQMGTGVAISDIIQIRDQFLDDLYQNQVANLGNSEIRAEFFQMIEGVFLEPGPNGLSSRINEFFNAMNEFSTNVESIPVRINVLSEASELADALNTMSNQLFKLRTNANEEVISFVPEINSLSSRIASINQQIAVLEVNGTSANDLRDDRHLLLDQLALLVNIDSRERGDGQVDVLVSGQTLVNGGDAMALEAVRNAALDPDRNDLVEVRFVKTGQKLNAQNGELFGAIEMRDNVLVGIDTDMDALAATLVEQINKIHGQASGLSGYSGTVRSSNAVTDPAVALNAAGLPYAVSPGSFEIRVFDESTVPPTPVGGTPVTINVTALTTLDDIAAQLNAVPNITAAVDTQGFLSITAAPGFSFSNANDDTNIFAAIGLNGLFQGFDAATISVNTTIANNPELLASRFSTDPLDTGDNTAALAMLGVQSGLHFDNNTATLSEFYESVVVEIGVATRGNQQALAVEQAFVANIERRRQEVSGVSLDEEVTLMIQYQRAFEASARVISVADRMLESLLTMAL